jgi:hypothetical protein
MTDDPQEPQAYAVELTLEMPEADLRRALAAWEWLLSQQSTLASGPLVLLAMPAISASESDEPSALHLRWVGIGATDPDDAAAQAQSTLDVLERFLPALGGRVTDARAYLEGPQTDDG